MADVSGPVSTLPGHRRPPPAGTCCDDHPDVPAAFRVQGETDSMGAEYHDLCAECVEKLNDAPEPVGGCDWCGTLTHLRPKRDLDEGSCGPVYQVCTACRDADTLRWQAECDDNRREGF